MRRFYENRTVRGLAIVALIALVVVVLSLESVLAALGVRDPGLGAALKPLLAPLPDPLEGIKRWMVVEAAYQRGAIEDIERQRVDVSTSADVDLAAWLARHRIGWHPQRTLAHSDAHWLRSMQRLDAGLHAAIDAFAREAADDAHNDAWHGLTWVNPVGSILIGVARPAYAA